MTAEAGEQLEVLHAPASPERRRQAPPVVLVHGICHGAWCWSDTYLPFLSGLGYDVYALSLRGHGGSTGWERLNEAGLQDYAADVLGVLQDLPEPAVVVGHSMGGAVVPLAARQVPQMFAGAVLLAPVVPGGPTSRERLASLRSLGGITVLLRLLAGRKLSARATNRLPFFNGRLGPEQVAKAASLLQQESRRAMADLRAYAPPAGALGMPVLVLGSRGDTLFGPASLQRTARHYDAELVVVDRACHDLMLDPEWETSARAIADWLTRTFPERAA